MKRVYIVLMILVVALAADDAECYGLTDCSETKPFVYEQPNEEEIYMPKPYIPKD